MKAKPYDIFISYRKKASGDKAEMLQQLLEFNDFKGRVSFDRDNLRGEFSIELMKRIDTAKEFLILVLPDTFANIDPDDTESAAFYSELASLPSDQFVSRVRNLQNEGVPLDYLRIEVGRALHYAQTHALNIVPITVQTGDNFSFSRLNLPTDIKALKNYQAVFFSTADEARFKDILPDLTRLMKIKPVRSKRWLYPLILGLLIVLAAAIAIGYHHNKKSKINALLQEMLEAPNGDYLTWSPDVTLAQAQAVHEILSNMIHVAAGTYLMGAADSTEYVDTMLEMPQIPQTVDPFMIGKYEVTIAEYCGVLGLPYNEAEAQMPVSDISYTDCQNFLQALNDLTDLNFRLPTEAEWEYAARGGAEAAGTTFAGSDDAVRVACYKENSGGRAHARDDQFIDLDCNTLDIYDMSGNLSEICDTEFRLYSDFGSDDPEIIDPDAVVLRGGDFTSEPYAVTVTHREPLNKQAKASTIGFRLVLHHN